ncbi:glutamate receptor 4-like [Penaeus vannamei]|uniref:glutamate receptor 4-like n=1 Tax=Penaeus vannamei TaxID=6689 RepID=UPI00387F7D80
MHSVPWEPRDVPVRVVAGMWLLATLIIGTVYRSNLKAMLILPKVVLPFDTFEEFAEVEVPGHLILGGVLEVASQGADPTSILGKIRAKSRIDPDIGKAAMDVIAGKLASIASASGHTWLHHSDFSAHGHCRLYSTRGGMYSTSISLGFPKGSSLRPKINFVLRGLKESGILQYLARRDIPNGTYCFNKPFSLTTNSGELRPLELGDFYGVLCLYAGGILLASLVLAAEHLVKGASSRTIAEDE